MTVLTSAASRFFRAKNEKPLPAPPSGATDGNMVISKDSLGEHETVAAAAAAVGAAANHALDVASTETDNPLWVLPVAQDVSDTEAPVLVNEKIRGAARKTKPADLVLKKRPSFVSLRRTSKLQITLVLWPPLKSMYALVSSMQKRANMSLLRRPCPRFPLTRPPLSLAIQHFARSDQFALRAPLDRALAV